MDMNHGSNSTTTEHACKISMLWNWYTVDACFISRQWHIRSVGAYAGTVIAIFFLVILLELFRRLGREYDRKISREYYSLNRSGAAKGKGFNSLENLSDGSAPPCPNVLPPFRPSIAQQAIRSFFYFVQFSAGYILMLLAMYYNGGLILAIFAGSYFGFFVSSWDTVGRVNTPEARGQTCC
ncbi:Copper transport protein CTR4 [Hypsizygus marmoreus]|uniref:Copper transport protein n=1 Tax=Hypsizygus marmoreus TaxID=39966 RepID=A0A369KG83_HYPMA|nr:Copper transport protein CTR4 [Hypsizygus marmoreus]